MKEYFELQNVKVEIKCYKYLPSFSWRKLVWPRIIFFKQLSENITNILTRRRGLFCKLGLANAIGRSQQFNKH